MLGLSMHYDIDIERILCYPITLIPMSMCRLDGSLYKTDKSAVVKFFEKQQNCSDVPKKINVVIGRFFFTAYNA